MKLNPHIRIQNCTEFSVFLFKLAHSHPHNKCTKFFAENLPSPTWKGPEALDVDESIKKQHIYIQRVDIERERKNGTHLAKSFFLKILIDKKRGVCVLGAVCVTGLFIDFSKVKKKYYRDAKKEMEEVRVNAATANVRNSFNFIGGFAFCSFASVLPSFTSFYASWSLQAPNGDFSLPLSEYGF